MPAAAAADDRPATVPALSSFHRTGGAFALRVGARVVVSAADRQLLLGEARTLAADLGLTATSRHRARPGDVVLARGGSGVGREGYELRIARTFAILARHTAGAFYGGRTLVALVRSHQAIPRGAGRDAPRYPDRGLMVDCGRAFYPRAWWLARIRQLSDLKLNLLHLHLSDDQGFRVETPSHPEIDTKPFLTRADVAAMATEARKRHVTIVPEVDMPGHLTAALAKHPELQLRDLFGQAQPDKLDVTLPAARKFVAEILGDLLPMFPGRWWHGGADEYLGVASTPADYLRYPQLEAYADRAYGPGANGKDAVIDFVNYVAGVVGKAGKRLRVWGDGIGEGSLAQLDRSAVVEWWENLHSQPPQDLIAEGYEVLNVGWWPLYYVTGGPLNFLRTTERDMYESWTPAHFEGPYTQRWITGIPLVTSYDVPDRSPGNRGATLAVWNDDPAAPGAQPAAVAAGITPRLRILAQKTWGSPELTTSYAAFARIPG